MRLTLLGIAVVLLVPMRSWSGSDDKERLAPIEVDPRATLTILYPGDHQPLPWQHGPPVRQAIAVVEGQRVPIATLPNGACPRVRVDLGTDPEEPEALFEDDGRHLWFPAISAQTSEHVDTERCEVVIDEAKAQIRWERIRIQGLTPELQTQLGEMHVSPEPLPD